MGAYAIILGCFLFALSFAIPPFEPVVREEPIYTRQDPESFANQLMWMGQDDGQ